MKCLMYLFWSVIYCNGIINSCEINNQNICFAQDFADRIIDDANQLIKKNLVGYRREGIQEGLLLIGPSGCGKTDLAKAIALKINLNTIFLSGALIAREYDACCGQNLKRLTDLVSTKQISGTIILDDLHLLCQSRKNKQISYPDMQTAVSQFLQSCIKNGQISLIACSLSSQSVIAPVKCHFTNIVELSNPNIATRERMLDYYLKTYASDDLVNKIAERTKGFSSRELRFIAQTMIAFADKRASQGVTYDDYIEAFKHVRLRENKAKSRFETWQFIKKYGLMLSIGVGVVEIIGLYNYYVKQMTRLDLMEQKFNEILQSIKSTDEKVFDVMKILRPTIPTMSGLELYIEKKYFGATSYINLVGRECLVKKSS